MSYPRHISKFVILLNAAPLHEYATETILCFSLRNRAMEMIFPSFSGAIQH